MTLIFVSVEPRRDLKLVFVSVDARRALKRFAIFQMRKKKKLKNIFLLFLIFAKTIDDLSNIFGRKKMRKVDKNFIEPNVTSSHRYPSNEQRKKNHHNAHTNFQQLRFIHSANGSHRFLCSCSKKKSATYLPKPSQQIFKFKIYSTVEKCHKKVKKEIRLQRHNR